MTVKIDLGHGRGWLAPRPAASIFRIDAALGRPADINEAGRSREKADEGHSKWLAYLNGTGPKAPYALPGDESVHVAGEAADSDDWYDPAAAAVWRDHGWRQTARYPKDPKKDEPWHGEHFDHLDNHRNDPIPPPATQEEPVFRRIYSPGRGYALIGPGYYRKLDTKEEIVLGERMKSGSDLVGNDREFDVWANLAIESTKEGE